MSSQVGLSELEKYYQSIQMDLKAEQLSEDEGGILEQIFTQYAIDLLAEAGETENARVAHDEGQLGTKNQHKINAYAEPDNYETIDLFITIFKGTEQPARISKEEIDTASKRITNFFTKAKYKDYVDEIEESSAIWDFAHVLATSKELAENLVRVNVIILTDGIYPNNPPEKQTILGFPFYYRIVDINYLYNITEKSHIPIEIDFKKEGFDIPCILSPAENDQYQSYLAIIPGTALATIYERFCSRLLEQNVRSFLQFAGKINNGIRKTIKTEPEMFLAYNNGISATAEEVSIEKAKDGSGSFISKVKDFQIVNGGQTTASIYHTLKKDKVEISGIFVQVKLSVVKNKEKFSEIVSSIAEYANTQNKVSVSDLSSNKPYHVELEKFSRNIFTPHRPDQINQTRWFYERARGQYKNARAKEGFTKAKQKAFDLKNPRNQMFTKEELAKYINSYQEVYDGKKLVIGPHIVVRGNQKNYAQFINYNLIKKPDSIYFEDLVSKAILFRSAEKLYGVKPNSIGDMRYITVPYSIALLNYHTNNKIDLYRIWKNQSLSDKLGSLLYNLMVKVEAYIRENAPGALYGEWAKKEDCWTELKDVKLDIDFKTSLKQDFEDLKNPSVRKRMADEETMNVQIKEEENRLRFIPAEVWNKIAEWGRDSSELSPQRIDTAVTLAGRIRNKHKISDFERSTGIDILNKVIDRAPELLSEVDKMREKMKEQNQGSKEMTIDLVRRMVEFAQKRRVMNDSHFLYMVKVVSGEEPFGEKAIRLCKMNLEKLEKYGFK